MGDCCLGIGYIRTLHDTNMDNSTATVHGEEVPQHLLEAIHKLAHTGASYQTICSVLGLKLEEVQQVLAKHPSQVTKLTKPIREKSNKCRSVTSSKLMTSRVMAPGNNEQSRLVTDPTSDLVICSPKKKAKASDICRESSLQDLLAQLHEDSLPIFIYSYKYNTGQLGRTRLVTGEPSTHQVPSYSFKPGCCWSEVPGGSLFISGGGWPPAVGEVVKIDTCREFAVSQQPPMLTPRGWHAAVYHPLQHLYAFGGLDSIRFLRECERYVFALKRWEALPPLPRACTNTSGVVVESSLYALGGVSEGSPLDLVQKLSLESLTWELMQLRLPHAGSRFPCFKLRDTEVYLVVNNTLYSFTALQVRPLKTLTEDIESWYGGSYYRRGTLYCSTSAGAVRSQEIGSLGN
jgi:hypothetical protein